MRGRVVLVALALGTAVAHAQPGARQGRIVDRDGRGVGGATVGTDAGASVETDAEGRFVLPAGAASSAFVYAEGYAPRLFELDADGATVVTVVPSDGAVEIIKVTGKAPDRASPTSYALALDQIRALPGTGNDALRAVQSLPGVGRASYGIGALILRGASPHESSVFLDGIEVPLAFHMGGLSSFFPSTLLDELVVTPGGGDIAFGRGIGGVVELRSRAPRRDRWRVGGELGVFDASSYAEGPAPGGGAVAIGLRRSYADFFLGGLLPEDRQVLPRYYDGQLRWDRTLAGGTLTGLGFFSSDSIVGWGGTDYDQGFLRVALQWRRRAGRAITTITPWAGWGRARVEYEWEDAEGPEHMRLDRLPLGLRGDVQRETSWGHLAAGVDLQATRVVREMPDALGAGGATPMYVDGVAWYGDAAAWIEARWRIDDGRLTLKPALRVDYFGISQAVVVEPRLVATHELAPWFTLRETFGLYHQPPGPADAVALPGEGIDLAGEAVRGQAGNAVHVSVGARAELPASVILSVTGYHVRTGGLKDPDQTSDPAEPSSIGNWGLGVVVDNLVGEEFFGASYDRRRRWGTEVSLQRRVGRWLSWLSYTLARSETHPGRPTLNGWKVTDLDQTHNLNAVVSVRLGAWQLGTRVRWSTGLPYTPRLSTMEGPDGERIDVWGAPNSRRLPDFLSLDIRLDRAWQRRWGTISAFVDVQNLTNADNPEGIFYGFGDPERLMRGLPILPTVGVSFQPPT